MTNITDGLTIIEASKVGVHTDVQRTVIQTFGFGAPLFEALPFVGIQGGGIEYPRQAALATVGFRKVNTEPTRVKTIHENVSDKLKILENDVAIDPFIIETQGPAVAASQQAGLIQASSKAWQESFFKGDEATDNADLNGLQERVSGDQLIAQGSTAGGDPLSLTKLDELISAVTAGGGSTVLAMSKKMRDRMSAAERTTGVAGFVLYQADEFGRETMFYRGIRIMVLEGPDGSDDVLPFDEVSPGGGASTSTSIYCINFGTNGVYGIQTTPIQSIMVLRSNTSIATLASIKWYAGFTVTRPRAVARLNGISDAPVIA